MRAVIVDPSSGSLTLSDQPDPLPGPGQMLVRVRAALGASLVMGPSRSSAKLAALQELGLHVGIDLEHESLPEVVRACQADVGDALAAGRLRPVVAQAFPLADVEAALDALARNQHVGKLVLVA